MPVECEGCGGLTTEDITPLSCSVCNAFYHSECVEVTEEGVVKNCKSCIAKGAIKKTIVDAPQPHRTRKAISLRSARSLSSRSSLHIQKDIDLLEERRKLEQEALAQMDRAREKYFQQEQQAIRDKLASDLKYVTDKTVLEKELEAVNNGSDKGSITSSQMARDRVEQWKTHQEATVFAYKLSEYVDDHRIVVTKEMDDSDIPQPPNGSSTVLPPKEKVNEVGMLQARNASNPCQEIRYTSTENVPHKIMSLPFNQLQLADKLAMASSNEISQDVATTSQPQVSRLVSKEALIARNSDMKNLSAFTGIAKEWPRFIRQFEQSTEICQFTDVDNIRRLDNCLKGNARKAVCNALSYPENVTHIINTLRQLFGRPEFILNELIQDLEQMPSVRIDKFDDIIQFSVLVANMCSTMVAAKMNDHMVNPLLLQKMVNKLPIQLKREWAKLRSTMSAVNIETFSLWISQSSTEFSWLLTEPPTFSESKIKKNSVNLHDLGACIVCQGTCSYIGKCTKFEELPYNDKWSLVKSRRLCRMCLQSHKGKCMSNEVCGINSCPYKHHKTLHKIIVDDKGAEGSKKSVNEPVNSHSCDIQELLFKILPVTLRHNNKTVETYALLDDGSSVTLIENWVAEALSADGVTDELCLKWTGDTHKVEKDSKRINVGISGGLHSFPLKNARTVGALNLPKQSISKEKLTKKFKHLKKIPFDSYHEQQPALLIGLDNVKLTTCLKVREGSSFEPVAGKTRLGWVVFGGVNSNRSLQSYHVCECQNQLDCETDRVLKNFIALDNLLTDQPGKSILSVEDEKALTIMKSTIRFLHNRYEIGLIWKYDNFCVPDSYAMAYRRLLCLEKSLSKDNDLRDNLNKQIDDYVLQGYAEKLDKKNIQPSSPSWYLPIFSVRNPNKPTKIRIVWDAASQVNNVSLNSLLLKGPDQLSNLPGVLFRFREFKIAVAGDIKQMFHQVLIRKQDRKFLRFLWRKSADCDVDIYQMNVMIFGASCSPSCSQFVKNVNADRFAAEMPLAVAAIKDNHYVDDWLQSVESESEAVDLMSQVRDIHKQGGFQIRNFLSNSAMVLDHAPDVNSSTRKLFQEDGDVSEKLLGMWWDVKSDTFIYSIKYHKVDAKILHGEKIPTKREVLKLLMSIFDPLGLIAHLLIYPKIFMQEVWKSGISWDDQVPATLHGKWLTWIKSLPRVQDVRIPRWYGLSKSSKVELHVFVDASSDAYAAVAYLRWVSDGKVRCSLISAKTKVAPLKLLSIPRLELSAAVLGCRLAQNIASNHSISFSDVCFWTDSKTVWCWLNSDHRSFKPFVAFRVAEILETTESGQWRWLPTHQNIADKATRQVVPSDEECEDWLAGPKFLYELNKENWPVNLSKSERTESELRSHVLYHVNVKLVPIQFTRFSKWRRLTGCTAYVKRYVHNLKATASNLPRLSGPLTKLEIQKAEYECFKIAQQDSFIDEIAELANGKCVSRKSSIFKLSVYLDDEGVLRSRSRLTLMVGAHEDFANPIVLPNGHYIVKLLIQSYHEKYFHQNHDTALHELQQRFHIQSLRSALRKVRSSCQYCKNLSAKPAVPVMADLPRARLTPFTRPFTYIGIDYFGPYLIAVNRNQAKRWGVLITCLNTRAVHLDICESLSTDSCICAIKRFMARRGEPLEIFSDQGTNFKGTSNELREAVLKLNQVQLASEFTTSTMQWHFNPPLAPHMGGVWERLVRSVKLALSYALSQSTRTPREELLRTMICEAEFIVNSRPLTYIPIETETSEVLTPNHFILGSSNGIKSFGVNSNDPKICTENWKRSNQMIVHFWKRWIREYLPIIRRRSKWFSDVRELEVGDIVVMLEDNYEQNSWRKAKVIDVTKSRDGHVRKATVQTATKNIYSRAASKLAILDIGIRTDGNTSQDEPDALPGGSVESNIANNNHP